MVRMFAQLLFISIISCALLLLLVYFFFTTHKKINCFFVNLIFKSQINIFSIHLLTMNFNKQIKKSLILYKQAYYMRLCEKRKTQTPAIKKIKLSSFLDKLNINNIKIHINPKLKKLSLIQKNVFLIYKPITIPNISKSLTKLFIRKSKFFTKTKYSWIRQECKNIVHLVLLFNIIVVFYSYAIYMGWKLKTSVIYAFLTYYICVYSRSLMSLKLNIMNIFRAFTFWHKPQIFTKRILKTKFKEKLTSILNITLKSKKK